MRLWDDNKDDRRDEDGEWYERLMPDGDRKINGFDRQELLDDDRRRVMAKWRAFEESDPGRWVIDHTDLLRRLTDEESHTCVRLIVLIAGVSAVWSVLAWGWNDGNPFMYVLGTLPLWIVAVWLCLLVWMFWDSYRDSGERAADRLNIKPGLATRRQVAAQLGARAVMRDVVPSVLPKTLDDWRHHRRATPPMPWDAAMLVGDCHGIDVWLDCERHAYVLGPTRSGKTVCVVIPAVVEAPGFCLVTSTRSDIIMATKAIREHGVRDRVLGAKFGGHGKVAIFDPEGIGADDPYTRHDLKWTPLMGCDDPTTARRRAQTLVSIGGFGDGSNNQEWGVSAGGFIQALLYAAAIGDLTIRSCYEWSLSPEKAVKAAEIIERKAPQGQMGLWADTISALKTMDTRLRENQWMGVKNAFAIIADPKVAARLDISPHDPRLADIKEMVRRGDTIYVISRPKDGSGGGNAGMLVALLLDTFQEACQQLAFSKETGSRRKIEPPARFVLDELSNIEKWPALRNAVTQGGGNGYQLIMVEQARAMMQKDYGKDDEETIWGNCHRLLLKGETGSDTLKWWVEQVGRHQHTRQDRNWNPGQGPFGGFSEHRENEDSIQPSELSRLPRGYMICYPLGADAPAFCRTRHYQKRGWWTPDAADRDRKDVR
ncbi:type VI secretion protein [Bifidobacterium rousetti]|uniref:type IV secretory system conjugative DNA transfer family protein n=1 Tax=Bifidobacterium rousetti TaxID=2045439 RepID=UPI001238B226|nr:TraM recognition domain-containing protein [Bifidobacterium rousetti]KAA8818311.1 type VI secretion protein [Bifidobacterium rousetti]